MNEEITEKLLNEEKSTGKKSKRTKVIIIGVVLIIAIILLSVLIYFWYRNSQFNKNLELGTNYLANGNYEQAVIAFNDASNFGDNLELKEKLAQANIYNGDIETGKDILNGLYTETGNHYYEILADSVEVGNLSSNVANEVPYIQGFDGIYALEQVSYPTASKQIIKYKYGEGLELEEAEIVYEDPNELTYLNLNTHYLYFISHSGTDYKVCRVDLNGNDYKVLFEAHDCYLTNLNIIGDHIYFIRNNKANGDLNNPEYVIEHDINGEKGGSIIFFGNSVTRLAADSENLFIYGDNQKDNVNGDAVYKYDINSQNLEMFNNPGNSSIFKMICSNKKLYLETFDVPSRYIVSEYDLDGGNKKEIYNSQDGINFGILGSTLYYSFSITGDDLPMYPVNQVEFYIKTINLDSGNEEDFYTANLTDSEFVGTNVMQPSIMEFNFLGSGIYFKEQVVAGYIPYTRECAINYSGNDFTDITAWLKPNY